MSFKNILGYKLVIFIIFCAFLYSDIDHQLTWMGSGRVHSEFNWYTIKTENFNVHYHEEIESIALSGANIAEQVLPILLEQVELESIPKIDIILTTEDEVMNGFAIYFNSTFIWVDQNDAAVWLENQKWLEQVIAHELQHIVYFNKVKTWLLEPYSIGYGETPGWFVEGIAEYYTEEWRPYRSEIRHKYNVLKNTTSSMDPHHDGFSKIKLMASMYGDSSIVKLLNYRDEFKLFNFSEAFKEATGVSVEQFNDHWRRTISTYYYGYRSQKETYEDIGEVSKLPISKLGSLTSGFKFTDDSLKIAMIGRDNHDNYYNSLIIASVDTTTSVDTTKDDNSKKRIKFNKNEIDFGNFHSFLSWSNDNRYLAYSKYHYANNNSKVYDLCLYDTKTNKKKWVTENMRATYPIFTNKNEIIFVAHSNSTSNLYKISIDTPKETEQLTFFDGDVQILTPDISLSGSKITFAMSKEDGNLDIYILNLDTKDLLRKTFDESVDYLPIFVNIDSFYGEDILFTSHRSGVPNIFKIDRNNAISQCTDVSEGVWGNQFETKENLIIANTLNDVDSVRIVKINPNRVVNPIKPILNEKYVTWKKHGPTIAINYDEINRNKYDYSSLILKYSPYKNMKHITSSLLPYPGLIVNTNWMDAIGRNMFSVIAGSYNYSLKDIRENFPATFFSISYTNAYKGPLFGINYFYNNNYSAKFYDKSSLLEKRDGLYGYMKFPYNSGESNYSNHELNFEIQIAKRTIWIYRDSLLVESDSLLIEDNYGLPKPVGGQDNFISINYKYINKKPQFKNWYLPSQGYGLESEVILGQRKDSALYQKIGLDAYLNYSLKNFILYSRFKFESSYGSPFPQDKVWFSEDNPIYVSGQRGAQIFGENLSPRGWRGDALKGNQMIFNTMEIRHSLPLSIPIQFFGTSMGESSIAIFQDYGLINESSIHTLGYEAKISILSSNTPILFLSYGQAQTFDRWANKKNPYNYIQMSIINPF